MKKFHQSVLLKEVIKYLDIKRDEFYIDATAGGGGHTFEILKHGAKVLAIDRDPDAIRFLESRVRSQELRVLKHKDLILVNDNFSHIDKIAHKFGFTNVSGVLFDLGVSSHQLEVASRGFSFQKEGPLDMRMDPNLEVKAEDIINNFEKRRLNEIFQRFADEKLGWSISEAIISARKVRPIKSTLELDRIVKEVYSKFRVKSKLEPATKVFQALRIVVNSELINLEEALEQTVNLLKAKGRLVIIGFHSLEDGIVKRFFKRSNNLRVLTKKPIGPSLQEIKDNPRARSAKLRAAERI